PAATGQGSQDEAVRTLGEHRTGAVGFECIATGSGQGGHHVTLPGQPGVRGPGGDSAVGALVGPASGDEASPRGDYRSEGGPPRLRECPTSLSLPAPTVSRVPQRSLNAGGVARQQPDRLAGYH